MYKAIVRIDGASAPELIGELRLVLPQAFYHTSGDAHVFVLEKWYIDPLRPYLRNAFYGVMITVEFSDTRRCRIRVILGEGDISPLLNEIKGQFEKICQSHGWQFFDLCGDIVR